MYGRGVGAWRRGGTDSSCNLVPMLEQTDIENVVCLQQGAYKTIYCIKMAKLLLPIRPSQWAYQML